MLFGFRLAELLLVAGSVVRYELLAMPRKNETEDQMKAEFHRSKNDFLRNRRFETIGGNHTRSGSCCLQPKCVAKPNLVAAKQKIKKIAESGKPTKAVSAALECFPKLLDHLCGPQNARVWCGLTNAQARLAGADHNRATAAHRGALETCLCKN